MTNLALLGALPPGPRPKTITNKLEVMAVGYVVISG